MFQPYFRTLSGVRWSNLNHLQMYLCNISFWHILREEFGNVSRVLQRAPGGSPKLRREGSQMLTREIANVGLLTQKSHRVHFSVELEVTSRTDFNPFAASRAS